MEGEGAIEARGGTKVQRREGKRREANETENATHGGELFIQIRRLCA